MFLKIKKGNFKYTLMGLMTCLVLIHNGNKQKVSTSTEELLKRKRIFGQGLFESHIFRQAEEN